jgi:hypothetical protein
VISCAIIAFACASSTGTAWPGDAFSPKAAPDQARCDTFGEGFFAVKGSEACVRIGGYVAAGVDFSMPRAAAAPAFAPGPATAFERHTAVSADARIETPLGPGRLYVRIGHDSREP